VAAFGFWGRPGFCSGDDLTEPVEFEVVVGTHIAGDLPEIAESDDAYLIARAAPRQALTQSNRMVVGVAFITGSDSPGTIDLTIESRLDMEAAGVATLRLMNWTNGAFDEVGMFPVGLQESVISVSDVLAADYVRAGDRRIELQIEHEVAASLSRDPFQSHFDVICAVVKRAVDLKIFTPTPKTAFNDDGTERHFMDYREVSEEDEETVGAFCVANLNDTDADGKTDVEEERAAEDGDDDEVKKTEAHPHGRDEVDLIGLIVEKPAGGRDGQMVKVTIVSGEIKVWETTTKRRGTDVAFPDGIKNFDVADLPKELYIEARAPSRRLREIEIKAEFGGKSDTVKATAVWATVTAVAHERRTAAKLFTMPEWRDITRPFPRLNVTLHNGTGLLRSSQDGIGLKGGILIKFQIQPPGVEDEAGVGFDGSRQKEVRYWVANERIVVPIPDVNTDFPKADERPNDDARDTDKSNTGPNDDSEYFNWDAPGFGKLNHAEAAVVQITYTNFLDFLRVRFDGIGFHEHERVKQATEGSRCSDKKPWHHSQVLTAVRDREWLYSDGGPSDGDSDNDPDDGPTDTETDANRIGEGHLTIAPTAIGLLGDQRGTQGSRVAVDCRLLNLTAERMRYDWQIEVESAEEGVRITPDPARGDDVAVDVEKMLVVDFHVSVARDSEPGTATLKLTVRDDTGRTVQSIERGTFTVAR